MRQRFPLAFLYLFDSLEAGGSFDKSWIAPSLLPILQRFLVHLKSSTLKNRFHLQEDQATIYLRPSVLKRKIVVFVDDILPIYQGPALRTGSVDWCCPGCGPWAWFNDQLANPPIPSSQSAQSTSLYPNIEFQFTNNNNKLQRMFGLWSDPIIQPTDPSWPICPIHFLILI